jgi:hypothetical protein
MIFRAGPDILESEKERNLYTKFFAGYFLNELIDGYDCRISKLCSYLSGKLGVEISLNRPVLSFDNHAYLLDRESDKGEFADILIHDAQSKTMIAIEAKYLTNWSIEKDIKCNINRIESIKQKNSTYDIHFCLLVSYKKWNATEKMKNHPGSSFTKFKKEFESKVGILFWEDLVMLCQSIPVCEYMDYRLSLVNASVEKRYATI